MADDDCPFCNYTGPVVSSFGRHAYIIVPLNPVVRGHRLVIPRKHFERAENNPEEFAYTMAVAAVASRGTDCNIIQSNGEAATQTVKHVHVHIVPRQPGDGLALPWSHGASVSRHERVHPTIHADCPRCVPPHA